MLLLLDYKDPRKVIVKKLALCVSDRPDIELGLTGDLSQLKKQSFVIKEGVAYKIRIDFIVQREIVHGLKYIQRTYRLGVPGKFLHDYKITKAFITSKAHTSSLLSLS